jgi:DNA-binding PadR family transcriptional regulator
LKKARCTRPSIAWSGGWLEAERGESELGRRAKLYRLTRQRRAHLVSEAAAWLRFVAGLSKVLLAQ